MRYLILLSLFGLLFLGGCGKQTGIPVTSDSGRQVGEIRMESDGVAMIMNTNSEMIGRVRGSMIRDEGAKKLGSIDMKDGHIILLNATGAAVGSLENGRECYGRSQKMLGSVPEETDTSAAAAACLLLLLPKED